MTKKKNRYFRNIIVNDKKYVWKISHYNCDGDGGSRFKIWDENKTLIYEKIIHTKIITPKIVKEKIVRHSENQEEKYHI